MSKTNEVGIFAVLAKMGPKLISTLLKTMKSATVLKSASAAATLGAYSLMFSWPMACSLVAFIFIHEYGHLLAMKKCGIKTRGIYLIPFVGGAAIADERFKTARNESFIAVSGPLMGCAFIIPMILMYFVTRRPIFAAIASTMALVNLFNLFPINPLDGGRMMKSFLYSFQNSIGFFYAMLSIVVAITLSIVTHFQLLALVGLIGLMEVITDYGLKESFKELMKTILRILGVCVILFILSLHYGLIVNIIKVLSLFVVFFLFFLDVHHHTINANKPFWSYPWIILQQIFVGIHKLFLIDYRSLKIIGGYDPMRKNQLTFYLIAYLGTILLMIAFILFPSCIPGCDMAKEMLK